LNAPEVGRLLQEHFEGKAEQWQITGPSARGGEGVIYRVSGPAFEIPLAVKWFHEPAAQQRYEALERASVAFGCGGEHGVPRPFGILADGHLLVMEWVDGRSLAAVLCRERPAVIGVEALANRAGRWLRRLHTVDAAPPAPLPIDSLMREIDATAAEAGVAERPAVRRGRDDLVESLPRIERTPVPMARVHGDFKPENVLLSEARTVGLDFSLRFVGPGVRDLANFAAHLLLLAYHPHALMARWTLHRDAVLAAFFDGHRRGGSGLEVPRPAFVWFTLHRLLRFAATEGGRSATGPTRHFKPWAVERDVARLSRDLAAATG
jgi:hypothetical protein